MDTVLQIRTSKKRKEKARKVLERVGLNLSSGVNLFLEQVVRRQSIPFVPTARRWTDLRHWRRYEKEIAWAEKHAKRYDSIEELHADLLK